MDQLGGNAPPIDGRLRLSAVLIVLVFATFGFRLFQLQIVERDDLVARSERNSVRTIRVTAPRGEILDREGRLIASFRPARELRVTPSDLGDASVTYAALAQLLDDNASELAERAGEPRGSRRFNAVTLKRDLVYEDLARVSAHNWAMPGVATVEVPRRHYVEGRRAAHLLGMLGEIRGDQLELPEFADYRGGEEIGQTGIESRFESHLRGRDGGRNVVVDAVGREFGKLDEVPPVPGGRVVLALDLDLQRAAEAGFLETPEGAGPLMGSAVALDIATGDVLAMASFPDYDPNDFAGGIAGDTWNALLADPWKPLRNRAIQNHYPPGSTHKPIVAAALLEEGVVDEHSTVTCRGGFRFGNRTYRCWKRSGHGVVDLKEAMKRSCDVFFYTFGIELGIDRMAEHARSFGLGRKSGIDLAGEQPGLVPDSAWKERRFRQPWYPGETVSAAIGQGYNLYTPLQLAISYAAIANGGTVMRPRIVLRLEDERGVAERRFPVRQDGRTTISAEHLARVRAGMTAVVEEQGGTGGRARVEGTTVAGKTGTAQVVRLEQYEGLEDDEIPVKFRDHAWFGAFAPVDDPQIAVGVFVEHGMHGSSGAAPIAQRIIEAWWKKQRPASDSPSEPRPFEPTPSGPTPSEPTPNEPTRVATLGQEVDRAGD